VEPGLDVRSVGKRDSDGTGYKRNRVAVNGAPEGRCRARVGALKHSGIGPLEKAHVRSIQRPTIGPRDRRLADLVGVLQHLLTVLLAFPTQNGFEPPLFFQHRLGSQYRKRLFGELIDNRHQIVDAAFDRVAQVRRKTVRHPQPQPVAAVDPRGTPDDELCAVRLRLVVDF
jgi:hypothetical protein